MEKGRETFPDLSAPPAPHETPQWFRAQIEALKAQRDEAIRQRGDARLERDRMRLALDQKVGEQLCGARHQGVPGWSLICVSLPHGPQEMHADAAGLRWP